MPLQGEISNRDAEITRLIADMGQSQSQSLELHDGQLPHEAQESIILDLNKQVNWQLIRDLTEPGSI